MKPEIPGQPTLMEELKASTLAFHACLQEAPFFAGDIRLQSQRQPLALLGYVYVLEGSMLGAMVLRPQFASAFQLAGGI